MNKINKNFIVIISTAFLMAVIYNIVARHLESVPRFNFSVGDIAPMTLRAPFPFDVEKSEAELEAETTLAMVNHPPMYRISDTINFEVEKNLNNFFIDLNTLATVGDTAYVYNTLAQRGFIFSNPLIDYLLVERNRNAVYDYLSVKLPEVMANPIVNDDDRDKLMLISDSHRGGDNHTTGRITLSDAKNMILRGETIRVRRDAISTLSDMFLVGNLIEDTDAMQREREKVKNKIEKALYRVHENDDILKKGQPITEQDIQKLNSLSKTMAERQEESNYGQLIIAAFGHFLFNIMMLSLFYYVTKYFHRTRYTSFNQLVMTYSGLFLSIFLSVMFYYVFGITYIMVIPIPMIAICIALVSSASYGIVFSLFCVLFAGQYLDWSMVPLINMAVASIICMIMIRKTKQTNYLLLFLYLLGSLAGASMIMSIYLTEGFKQLFLNLSMCLINASVSIIGAFIIVPILERKLGVATKDVLLNLIDYNNPLLKRLAKEAQGTYYHSLIVGNLAEECAEAIGANPMMARVGSYYHDIGKLEQPDYFIENQHGENPHDTIPPLESATIIKNHIKNGVTMARKARLPHQIVDIIQQHHGDSKIRYFLHKAQTEISDDTSFADNYDINDFAYSGPKPKTKEAVIVMIADIVESTTKSSKDQSDTVIEKIIHDSIEHLLAEDQLIDAPITLKELSIIKQTILPILCSIYRRRIEYPDEK